MKAEVKGMSMYINEPITQQFHMSDMRPAYGDPARDLPENSRRINVSPLEGARDGFGGTQEAQVKINHITVGENGRVLIVPTIRHPEQGLQLGATQIAVLLHRYGIVTEPETARNYGNVAIIAQGQLPRLLGVLVKNGLGRNIAGQIAERCEVQITPEHDLEESQDVQAENFGNRIAGKKLIPEDGRVRDTRRQDDDRSFNR